MIDSTPFRLRFWLAAAVMAASTAAFGLVIHFRVGGPSWSLWLDDVGTLASAWAGAGLCAWRWRRSPRSTRRFWAYLSWSAFAWGAGELVWAYYELLAHHAVPFPSMADAGFLAAVPLGAAALLAFPAPRQGSKARLRASLDGGLMAGALLFISWATVLGPVFRAHEGNMFEQLLALAYPAGDVVIAALAISVAARAARTARVTLGLVAGGIIALALADSAFAYLAVDGRYGIGGLADSGWFAGYLLVGLGALWPTVAGQPRAEDHHASVVGTFVPYVPVVAALAVAVVRWLPDHTIGPMLASTGLGLFVMLAVRQWIALADNVALGRRLEIKVERRGRELVQQDARFSALVRHSSDLTTILSDAGVIEYQSPSSEQLLGRTSHELEGTLFVDLLCPSDAATWLGALLQVVNKPGSEVTVEWRLVRLDGSLIPVETRMTNMVADPAVAGIVLNSRDISERTELEKELRHQAFHDPLTGLANRSLFRDRLEHALAMRSRSSNLVAVLFLDLDDFKAVNDGRGHASGDALLRAVSKRLATAVRAGDTVARLGGDEFAVLVEGMKPDSDPMTAADRIMEVFRLPFVLDSGEVFVKASIGVAVADDGLADAGELLRNADVAMYAAKSAGKGRCETFRAGLHEQVIGRLNLESDLRGAVEREEFVVYYQPIVDITSGRPVGVEALVRWQHPTRGLIPPSEFIPAAEASGLIIAMGSWLMGQACRDITALQHETGNPRLGVSVNLSARQLEDPALCARVAECLAESELDPELLMLEITETAIMADPDRAVDQLRKLSRLGVKLAVDDFGTGYSSLSYLQRLPVDELKIDRSFVSGTGGRTAQATALVRTIVRLADDLRLTTVAEGIETAEEWEELREAGCDLAQGFLFARPVDVDQLRQLLMATPMPSLSLP